MNPIFQLFNNQARPKNTVNQNECVNTKQNILNKFMEFCRTYTGNPSDDLNKLINSGRYTEQEVNNAIQTAKQIEGIIKPFLK